MSDFAASVLAPVVESGVKYVVAAIKRQLIYLCCFITNINALKDEATKLDEAIVGVQAKVDVAKNNLQEIHPEVTSWFGASDNYKNELNTILQQAPNVETGCLRVARRFSLSRRAKKTTEAITQHREKCKLFVDVSLPPPAAACRPTPLGTTYEFNSRKKIEQDIMTALRDGNERMIGICGMGGLGKTTMAKRIRNRALEEHLFQEVVMAVVSQPVDKLKLQVEIGGTLGLNGLENEPAEARVQKLYERLTSDTKRILLVLDDVWTNLDLNELGIPCEGDPKRCTILITSRNHDTLRKMDVREVLGMESLSEEDAWFMFREKAGTCVDDRKLKATAKKVVEKCRGLPIALATVGVTLKDEKSLSVWKDALKQLRKANPNNTPRFIAEVYNPLMLSYDRLESEEAKSLFLLCCLYPEDANIEIEQLTYFCMGLHTFTDVRSLEEARDRICTLIKSLKSRSLLLDGDDEDYDAVKMHDVVRDVCIFIAKQKGYIGGNDCTWISSVQLPREGTELPIELGFPNLRLLFLSRDEFKVENLLLERMRELCVLSIEQYSWTSLPHITQSLSNVRTLVLDSCMDLETISVVGSLKNLEILMCRRCYRIEELPQEIRGLMHLKLLELTRCDNLKSIAPGIISSLVGLEELKMFGSFKKWEADDGERQNAGLRELESLTKLTCLEIQITDPTLAAQQIKLSSKLERFLISIDVEGFYGGGFNKIMNLRWEENICLGHWMEKLVNDTEYLHFLGNGANNLDLASINQNVKELYLDSCDSLKNIGTTSMDDDGGETLFSHMESLTLTNLPQLQKIWNGPISSNSFQNLKSIDLSNLPVLKQLWSSNTGMPQLQTLKIEDCEMMEQVIMCREGRIEFPLLKELSIIRCPRLRNIIATSPLNADNDDHYLHLFCQPQKVSFGSLNELMMDRNPICRHNNIHLPFFNKVEILYINRCRDSMSLFIPSIAKNLVNLKRLTIGNCDEMVEVIEDDNEENQAGSGGERYRLFPNLLTLVLRNLPKLEIFCKWKRDVELPSLTELHVYKCPNMARFSLGSTTTPDCTSICLEDCEMMEQVIMCRQGRIEFPLLEKLSTFGCPKLRNIIATSPLNADNDDHYLHLFCQPQKVSFGILKYLQMERNPFCRHNNIHLPFFSKLKGLYIWNCHDNMSLFIPSIAKNLVNLKRLAIGDCDEMVEVIEDDNEENQAGSGGERYRLFPNLLTLVLRNLPKLEIFCKWKRDVELPSLTELHVYKCPNMARFSLGSTTTPDCTSICLDDNDYDIDASTDLNGALQKHYV